MLGAAGRRAPTRFVDPADLHYDMHLTVVTFEAGGDLFCAAGTAVVQVVAAAGHGGRGPCRRVLPSEVG